MAVPDIVSSEVYPWGEFRPFPRRQWSRVDPVADKGESEVEVDRHYAGPDPPPTHGTRNRRNFHRIPSRRTYSCAWSPWTGNPYSINMGTHTEPAVSASSLWRIIGTWARFPVPAGIPVD